MARPLIEQSTWNTSRTPCCKVPHRLEDSKGALKDMFWTIFYVDDFLMVITTVQITSKLSNWKSSATLEYQDDGPRLTISLSSRSLLCELAHRSQYDDK